MKKKIVDNGMKKTQLQRSKCINRLNSIRVDIGILCDEGIDDYIATYVWI